MTPLRDFPAVRKLAEEMAQRRVDHYDSMFAKEGREAWWRQDDHATFGVMHATFGVMIEAELRLLTDLEDPYARAVLVVLGRESDGRWRAHYDEENEDWVALGPWPDPEDEAWAPDQPGYYYLEGCDCEEDARHAAMHERDQWWHNIQDDPAGLEAELREVLRV